MATTDRNPRLRFNDDRFRSFRGKERPIAFICEEPSCHTTVPLSAEAYEARRPGPVLCPAHAAASG